MNEKIKKYRPEDRLLACDGDIKAAWNCTRARVAINCPACGGEARMENAGETEENPFRVVCTACGHRGPPDIGVINALFGWNARHPYIDFSVSKSPYLRRFSSREAKQRFEQERELWIRQWIQDCSRPRVIDGTFYRKLFQETFLPRHRARKNIYELYCGGWWEDEHDVAWSDSVIGFDTGILREGKICLVEDWVNGSRAITDAYVKRDGILEKVCAEDAVLKLFG